LRFCFFNQLHKQTRMNKVFLFLLFIGGTAVAQAGNPGSGDQLKVKTDESVVAWTATKVTGRHNGTVDIKEGTLEMKDGILTGGSLTMDMTTITDLDQTGGGKTKLEGHLRSDDFFAVDTYPTSTLVITKVEPKGDGLYHITANMTIKGITNPVQFDAALTNQSNTYTATSDIKIDRTLYNVRYGSNKFFDNLGDKAISDVFDLNVKLVAAGK
jgi:hypothetical protein